MRVFPGNFHFFERGLHEVRQETFAPSVPVEAAWRDRRAQFTLLIDTGAETTTLFPSQATALFGDALAQFDFDDPDRRVMIGDVGGTLHAAIEEQIDFTLHDDADAPSIVTARVLVNRPNPPDSAIGRGNWDTPSLLGRDLLLHFDLYVSGSRGEAYLSLPD